MNNDLDNFLKNQDQYSDSDYFDLEKNNINPTEPFQNSFNQVSNIKDNDIFLNFLNNENVNSIINELENEIKSNYLSSNFDEIISLIENNFGNYFFQLNSSLLYLITKLKFFTLLQRDKLQDAIKLYDEQFLPLIKRVKSYNWIKKNKFCEKLIRKPEKIKNKDFIKKYNKEFQYELNKSINKYLYNEEKEDNFIIDEPTKGNKTIHQKNKLLLNEKIKENENQKNIIFDPSINIEYFQKQNENPTIINEPIINNIHNQKVFFEKINNDENINNDELTLYKQLPFLSSFKPHYAKRETIDKKTIRTFRQYLIEENKKKSLSINKNSKDYSFYISLIRGRILPPSNFYDSNTNENLTFKSFNSHFLLWFFSREGIRDLYANFLNSQGDIFIKQVTKYYKLNQKESEQLNSYMNNLPFIFDISLVNNLTKGNTFSHIYRKQKHNKKKNKILFKITKCEKKKKERSRSKQHDNEDNVNKSFSSFED